MTNPSEIETAVEQFARDLETYNFDNVANALSRSMCCDGHMCGCQGSSIGDYLAHELRTLISAASARGLAEGDARKVKRYAECSANCDDPECPYTHQPEYEDAAPSSPAAAPEVERIDRILAEMIAVATAKDGTDLADEWPLDLRAQVDVWQATLQPALGHPDGFRPRAALRTPPAPTADLALRCAEIISWRNSGRYTGTALQEFADKLELEGRPDASQSMIRRAELDTITEALELIAKGALRTPPAIDDRPLTTNGSPRNEVDSLPTGWVAESLGHG